MRHVERARRWISASNAFELDTWVRGLLIHYFFHVSDRRTVEVVPASSDPSAPRLLALHAPTVFKGEGRIRIAAGAVFGVARSPGSCSCSYVEARTPDSLISVGAGTTINNRATIVAEGSQIHIGERCLIGPEFQAFDANGHRLTLGQRHLPDDRPRAVTVEDDVFIGARVTLLKGCRIGRGSVVSAGAVVPPSFEAPPLSIVAGNPASVVGQVT